MNFRKLILFSTGLALFPSFTKAQLKKISSGVYELNAGHMSLQVDAERGARIVSLRLAGKETLSTVKIHPENYGSTLWLSPQQNWGWPPYVVLDVKPYRVVANTKNSITLQSSPDSVSGCSMSKVITANCNDTSFSIVYTITNISSKEKKLAPWEVSRVPTGGFSFFPLGEKTGYRKSTIASEDIDNVRWISYNKNTVKNEQKMFHDGSEGWLAHVNAGILFIQQFSDNPASSEAPKEAEIEIYVNSLNSYLELENQGKYETLRPGERLTRQVKWYLRDIPSKIKVKPGAKELIAYVRGILK